VTDSKVIKIGQFPSFADISVGDKSKYKTVLKDKLVEYNKALGLFAHGVGIGSLIYLRRIIENLIFEKYCEIGETLEINKEDFEALRFVEKIETLKNHLPNLLYENRNLYGIVSKGVHELNEAECVSMFPDIKIGIELILDEILHEMETTEKAKGFSTFVANTTGELRAREG